MTPRKKLPTVQVPQQYKRGSILRRDLNDVVRDVSGKVSAAKVSALVGQSIAAYLLLKHAQAVIERWDALAILLTILVAPDNFRKVINMKYSSGAKT
tara:strand:+ start:249 stop:539 length:291 start_codon:yes stop_codon:yes gene_type:complete